MRARVVAVTSASRTAKDGKRVFVIECELDSVVWSVLRRERQVSELHVTLSQLMRFVPDSPIAPRSWIWGRAAEQDGAVAKRVEDYLRELTATGQWVWDEMSVLRHFLQIPISSEKRQVRELMLNEIRTHGVKDARKQLLATIRKGERASRLSTVPQEQGADEGQRNTDGRPHSSRPLSNSALHKVHELTLPPKEAALAALGGGGGGSHRQGEGGFAVRGGFAGMLEAVRDALESGKDSARNRPAEPF